MTLKSIIDLDINDAKFTKFSELFAKYQTALKATPGEWKKVSDQQRVLNSQFQRGVETLLAQGAAARDNDDADEKRVKRLTHTEKLWTSMAKSSGSMAKNVLDIGAGVLKWGAILGGGLLGGSLFGIDRMANSASDQRRSSTGLGLSIGEQKAFDTNFNRFVNPNAFLGGISNATSNIANQGPLYALGVNPNQSTSDVAIATLRAVRAKALSTPINQLGILGSTYGLDKLGLGTDDIRRLRSASTGEFNDQMAHYGKDVKALGFSDKTAKSWQDFSTQMSRAGDQIMKIFVNGLMPLEKPLENLSASFVKFLETLSKSPLIKEGIDKLAGWLNDFSGELSSPKWLDTVKGFLSDVGALADAMHWLAHPYDNTVDAVSRKIDPTVDATSGMFSSLSNWFQPNAGTAMGYLAYLAKKDLKYGLPAGTAESVFQQESGGNLYPKISAAGAVGPFQFMPGTAKQYGINPFDPLQSADAGPHYIKDLRDRYGGDLTKALAAYNYGPDNLDKVLKAHPDDWLKYAPKETRNYVAATAPANTPGVTITIINATGGAAIPIVAGLAQ